MQRVAPVLVADVGLLLGSEDNLGTFGKAKAAGFVNAVYMYEERSEGAGKRTAEL